MRRWGPVTRIALVPRGVVIGVGVGLVGLVHYLGGSGFSKLGLVSPGLRLGALSTLSVLFAVCR